MPELPCGRCLPHDGLQQIFGVDVHGEHAVVFVGHNHMAFATLDTGVDYIFFLTHQPTEIRAVDTELIETRHNPTQHFVDFISFGNYGELAVESAEETVRGNFLTRQHITADVAQVFVGGYIAFENIGEQCAYTQLAVCGFQHFTACYGYGAGEVYATGVHQTADKDYGFRADGPYRLALSLWERCD